MSSPQETEVAAKHRVLIFVNNRPAEFARDTATGSEIKAAADVPEDFHLYGPQGELIENHEHIHLHKDERFTAISGHDVS